MKGAHDDLSVICSILDFGKGSQVLRLSKDLGGIGGVIFLGKGTVNEKWLKRLGIVDVRKEVLLSLMEKTSEDRFYREVTRRYGLDKPQNGIAFSMPLKYFMGGKEGFSKRGGGDAMAYQCIFAIVDKGSYADVLDAAESAGSTGGTVIHARGSGSRDKAKLFDIEIEPEKDVVLILSREETTEKIVNSVSERLGISRPNAGVIFVMEVSRTLGLYEK